ncbi:hypothetical protein POJ06DRAFT_263325 [Lipomyces tetrasporus]|uniref:Uncharacterized protein n=1 Tax=Lipomyces tetrasporus TaxID=54092 RepID=A0AAD7VNU8_9ASCO|nr:uncharacterized protein POJ06DRAFT_263325 [Lipomyces tetrasporus]KAJ8096757.1 hypothetical protein POJ06DRAFT_263325 [Lipomyces tetrasporus]
MPAKVYRSLLQELSEWMTSARSQQPPAVSRLLQQTLDMSAPPPPPPPHATGSESTSDSTLDQLHQQLKTFAQEQFRSVAEEHSGEAAEKKTRDAIEILTYLRSQRTYKALLDKYNPTATLEDHERIRLTARRVGLELPKDIQERFQKEDELADNGPNVDEKTDNDRDNK